MTSQLTKRMPTVALCNDHVPETTTTIAAIHIASLHHITRNHQPLPDACLGICSFFVFFSEDILLNKGQMGRVFF